MNSSVQIRKAIIKDIPQIFDLVKELAVFENAEKEVTVNEDYYEKEFSKNTFDAIVAESDNEIIGICLFYMTFSTWKGRMLYLEDFVVKQSFRAQGIGQLLYDSLLAEAKKLDAKLVKWQVLDWNDPAINFYKKNNAVIEKEWWNCKIIF